MKKYSYLLFVVMLATMSVALSSCGKTSSDNSTVEPKPIYTCTIHSDNNGELQNANGERVCAVNIYSRGEPLSMNFSVDVVWSGVELKKIYLKEGNVYNEFPFSSKKDELIPIASYNMSTNGTDMTFQFYALSSEKNIENLTTSSSADDGKNEQKHSQTTLERKSFDSANEISKNIDGTIWTHTEPLKGRNQFWYRLRFNNGKVYFNRAYPRDGEWNTSEESSYDYTIEEDRYIDTGEKYTYLSFGQFRFIPSTATLVIYYPNDIQYYNMRIGEYNWD